ncbi:hypothetical protein SLEP1_g3797 [Rubroshorea leprosula]|uniref:Uncharacterized protein n=1 Tax=Rubroshorea leprosula TaxID=152421 RepID=A0AAV5HW97_9ROSI|nr:hypothetical protein SLEP1_g3797 [Rubroshorea leprosula]
MVGIKDIHQADLAVARFFFDSCIPINAINSPYFQPIIDAITTISPSYKGSTYHTVRTNLLKDLKNEVQLLVDSYRKVWEGTSCTIMGDACALAPCSAPDVPPAPRSRAIITPAPALHRICINLQLCPAPAFLCTKSPCRLLRRTHVACTPAPCTSIMTLHRALLHPCCSASARYSSSRQISINID